MTDTNKLKELAAQYLANPSGTAGEDSEFRAAANPQAILGLIAEVEHLRKDAARYRWLRDSCTRQWDVMCRDIEIVINGDGAEDCEDLDGIIDSALEGATQ